MKDHPTTRLDVREIAILVLIHAPTPTDGERHAGRRHAMVAPDRLDTNNLTRATEVKKFALGRPPTDVSSGDSLRISSPVESHPKERFLKDWYYH